MKVEIEENIENNWIMIYPDFSKLLKHLKNKQMKDISHWKKFSYDRDKYIKVSELLQVYGILDKQSIDNFCHILQYLKGNYNSITRYEGQQAELAKYYSELGKLKKALETENISSIGLKFASNKGIQKPMISLTDSSIIDPIIEILKNKAFNIPWDIIEAEKISKGGQVTLQSAIKKEYKYQIISFLEEYPELSKLNKNEKFYFIGRLFAIAGILKEESEEIIEGYDSYKKYLIKFMKKI